MGADSDLEWVELYNSDENQFNFSGFTINGKKMNSQMIDSYAYLVIVNELIDGTDADNDSFQKFYGSNISAVESKAFSLSNTGAEITISNGSFSFHANYSDQDGGDGNGHSLELVNSSWVESKELYGTPGRENTGVVIEKVGSSVVSLDVYLREPIYHNYFYDKLFKITIKNKDNCSNKEEISVEYNLSSFGKLIYSDNFVKEVGCSSYSSTGKLIVSDPGEYTLCGKIVDFVNNIVACKNITVVNVSEIPCDINLSIITERMIYQEGEKIKYYHILNDEQYPYSIEYWVEDLLGQSFKTKSTTFNLNQKSYTPKIEEIDRVLLFKAKVYPLCADLNSDNNLAEKMVIITKPIVEAEKQVEKPEESSIEIVKISPLVAKFGGVIKVEVEIYKGSTSKYSLSAYLEKDGKKISEVTKFNLQEKNTKYKLTLPLLINPNCDGKIKDGAFNLIVEGLDEKAERKIKVQDFDKDVCKNSVEYIKHEDKIASKNLNKEEITSSSPSLFVKNEDANYNLPIFLNKSKLNGGFVVYQSSSDKAKELIPYVLITTFILLLIVLWRKI